jgi:hypothetical protein
MPHCPRFSKEHCFSEGFQASPACHFSKCGIELKISVEHRLDDTDRGCHSDTLSTANRTWADLELNLGLFGERWAIRDSH